MSFIAVAGTAQMVSAPDAQAYQSSNIVWAQVYGANAWQVAEWQPFLQPVQPCNIMYSNDASLQGGITLASPTYSQDGLGQYDGQLELQNPSEHGLQPTAHSLQGRMVWLATQELGSRLVQQALDEATFDVERVNMASELRTQVWEMLKCPNGNHVLQKCIDTVRPLDSQFIIDEISGSAAKAARHRYGCRVLQRLLEHCTAQAQGLVEELLREAIALSTHIYGNYVMQHLLEHGRQEDVVTLTQLLAEHISTVCRNSYGGAVLGQALALGSPTLKTTLANALLARPAALVCIGGSRHGLDTVRLALEAAEPEQRAAALATLMEERHELAKSRYGRAVTRYLELWPEYVRLLHTPLTQAAAWPQ